MDVTRICVKCGYEKPLSEFHFYKSSGKYGFSCRECYLASKRKYNHEHKKEMKEYLAAYRQEHHDELCRKKREYYAREEVREHAKKMYLEKYRVGRLARYANNKAAVNKQNRKYRQLHKCQARLYHRVYYEQHRERILAYHAKYKREHPERHRAHVLVREAIRRGVLVRLPCRECGESLSEGHHKDYTKPLDVVWLCASCHRQAHVRAKLLFLFRDS